MEKSNLEKLKELLLYAPVGAIGFVKDNAPTFFTMFVSRGRRDVNKSAMSAEEKISLTKEKGQFVAMGTPIAKNQAEQFAQEAKQKGESFTRASIEVAGAALSVAEGFIQSLVQTISPGSEDDSQRSSTQSEVPAKAPEAKTDPVNHVSNTEVITKESVEIKDDPSDTTILGSNTGSQFVTDTVVTTDFAQPLESSSELPRLISEQYDTLSAPEIIDMLDLFSEDDLLNIQKYESGFRNRQTIIHAIAYRLNS